GLTAEARSRITVGTEPLFERGAVLAAGLEPLGLPGGNLEWNVELEAELKIEHHSASSLEWMLGCPLRWALAGPARLRTSEQALPSPHLLNGSLGHRLVEELHLSGAFGLDVAAFRERAESEVAQLIRTEGALLLRAG